jgi:hypothetical protein
MSLIARYEELKPRRVTRDVSYAADAATAGAVDQLLVDLDAVVPGLLSDVDGIVTKIPLPMMRKSIMSSTRWHGGAMHGGESVGRIARTITGARAVDGNPSLSIHLIAVARSIFGSPFRESLMLRCLGPPVRGDITQRNWRFRDRSRFPSPSLLSFEVRSVVFLAAAAQPST